MSIVSKYILFAKKYTMAIGYHETIQEAILTEKGYRKRINVSKKYKA